MEHGGLVEDMGDKENVARMANGEQTPVKGGKSRLTTPTKVFSEPRRAAVEDGSRPSSAPQKKNGSSAGTTPCKTADINAAEESSPGTPHRLQRTSSRSQLVKNAYSDVRSPVGEYIRGLSPTVKSPATRKLIRAIKSPALQREMLGRTLSSPNVLCRAAQQGTTQPSSALCKSQKIAETVTHDAVEAGKPTETVTHDAIEAGKATPSRAWKALPNLGSLPHSALVYGGSASKFRFIPSVLLSKPEERGNGQACTPETVDGFTSNAYEDDLSVADSPAINHRKELTLLEAFDCCDLAEGETVFSQAAEQGYQGVNAEAVQSTCCLDMIVAEESGESKQGMTPELPTMEESLVSESAGQVEGEESSELAGVLAPETAHLEEEQVRHVQRFQHPAALVDEAEVEPVVEREEIGRQGTDMTDRNSELVAVDSILHTEGKYLDVIEEVEDWTDDESVSLRRMSWAEEDSVDNHRVSRTGSFASLDLAAIDEVESSLDEDDDSPVVVLDEEENIDSWTREPPVSQKEIVVDEIHPGEQQARPSCLLPDKQPRQSYPQKATKIIEPDVEEPKPWRVQFSLPATPKERENDFFKRRQDTPGPLQRLDFGPLPLREETERSPGDEDEEDPVVLCHELLMGTCDMDPANVRLQGWLKMKPNVRSSVGSGQWKARWVVVYNNFCFVFRSMESKRPMFAALLDHAKATMVPCAVEPSAAAEDALKFKLSTRVGRQLFFQAEDSSKVATWLEALGKNSYEQVAREAAQAVQRRKLAQQVVVFKHRPPLPAAYSSDTRCVSLCAIL